MRGSSAVLTRLQHNVSEFVKHFGALNLHLYEVFTSGGMFHRRTVQLITYSFYCCLDERLHMFPCPLLQSTIEVISRVVHILHNPHDIGHLLLVADGCPDMANNIAVLSANIIGMCTM